MQMITFSLALYLGRWWWFEQITCQIRSRSPERRKHESQSMFSPTFSSDSFALKKRDDVILYLSVSICVIDSLSVSLLSSWKFIAWREKCFFHRQADFFCSDLRRWSLFYSEFALENSIWPIVMPIISKQLITVVSSRSSVCLPLSFANFFSRKKLNSKNCAREIQVLIASIIPLSIDWHPTVRKARKVSFSSGSRSTSNWFLWLLLLHSSLDFPLVISSFLVAIKAKNLNKNLFDQAKDNRKI